MKGQLALQGRFIHHISQPRNLLEPYVACNREKLHNTSDRYITLVQPGHTSLGKAVERV